MIYYTADLHFHYALLLPSRPFATVEEIAAYIGDLESTTQKYYIAIRKKVVSNGEVRQVVKLPGIKEETTVA